MKLFVILFLIFFVLASCNGDSLPDSKEIDSSSEKNCLPFIKNKMFEDAITNFINTQNKIDDEILKDNIITVTFKEKGDECLVELSNNYFYWLGYDGYTICDNFLILFYNYNSCNLSFLELRKLELNQPEGYNNEDNVKPFYFEPYIENYIIKSDSIILLEKIQY